ncbi:WecB/TagA/CpsF family glycosyltransferase [Albimonas sp. CAU 1670]|uniref:WecB/TagA/CpsF family glycosyltransferase n=1 Tax=Albimonas sp. CAU 1670 TaxID=3032599 RepID=UPI0023D98967|nr:WecB/TagA/CpsF family glycosyltransferase [Albimonas sp. CAU 1670]MDF2231627.1 WecB/TagA/CpsF family glycosyltransferase [Albimonas sp. CAU 1670]
MTSTADTGAAVPAPAAPAAGRMGDRHRVVKLLNAYVHDVTMDEVVREFDRGLLLTLHVDMIMKLQSDREFHAILDEFDVITCDSQILYFATKFLGTPVRERVSGSDFFPRYYMHHKDDPDVRIFICGGQPGVAEIARDKINAKVGREIIVGVDAPSFDFDRDPAESERIIKAVEDSGATVLLVGLGGGRQEKFIVANRHRFTNIHTFLPLGGTIDYEAGSFVRPPAWITEWGFEWLYRLVKEPRQRWHRYVVHQPPVLWHLLRQKLGLYRDPFATSDKP